MKDNRLKGNTFRGSSSAISFFLSFFFCFPSQLGISLTLLVPETKIAEFANSVDLDEVAHYEPPYLDLHCLSSNL